MADRKKIFVETSVVSLLVARRSQDSDTAKRQTITRAWWRARNSFELFASTAVRDEAATGDPRESKKRLAILHTMIPLVVNPAAEAIALGLLDARILPKKAETDALHLGTAMAHYMDCVLSWNFKHLVNPTILRNIYLWAGRAKYNMPVVCTPEDLLRDLS